MAKGTPERRLKGVLRLNTTSFVKWISQTIIHESDGEIQNAYWNETL